VRTSLSAVGARSKSVSYVVYGRSAARTLAKTVVTPTFSTKICSADFR